MATDYLSHMTGYWNQRYAAEGMIWGTGASPTAAFALELFGRKPGGRLLVPGAGYGRNARFFAENGYRVTGVETAATAVAMAVRLDPRSAYLHGSFLDIELEPGTFDAVYCYNVLHLFRAAERHLFVQKCLSLLRSDGVAFFTAFSERAESFGRGNMVEPNTFESKPGRPVHYFTEEDLVQSFSGCTVLNTGIIADDENHGEEGPHTHLLQYIYVRKPLDFDAPKYRAYSRHTKTWGTRVVAELNLQGNENVLDLGCGDGLVTRQIADLLPRGRVVGIDSSRSMISEAEKLEGPNLRFLLQDITALDFHAEFDVIFSNAALHWVKDHDAVLRKCHAALKDNGLIRFNFGGRGNCATFLVVTRELIASEEFGPFFTGFPWPWYMPGVDEYRNLIFRCPYRNTRVWKENADIFFATAGDLVGWIDQPSIVPFLKHLPDGARDRFRNSVVDRMLSLTRQGDGRYFEAFRRINVLARK
ncbi:MAG: methyltransferase domain-containing protein [Peptococcaceae bacterium]|jgi:trans-aconitate methyltransferase|nr:methyltransferase domain-containing protein [Peptococcaceae bacterium]